MYKIILIAFICLVSGCASTHDPYMEMGVSHKFRETTINWHTPPSNSIASKITCNLEIGMENDNTSYGYRHSSQCFVGAPFNNDDEYGADEVFFNYKFKFGKE